MPAIPTDQQLRLSPQTVSDLCELPGCHACDRASFNAWETPHGCRLCGSCYCELLDLEAGQGCPGRGNACPTAVSFRRSDCREDTVTRLELASELVHCVHERLGCSFVCQFCKLWDHLTHGCQFRRVTCQRCSRRLRSGGLELHQCSDECRQFLLENLGSYSGHTVSVRLMVRIYP